MPVDGPSYLAGRTDERVLTMFCQVLTIDACGQALRVLTLSTINNDQPCLLREEIVQTACEAKAGSTLEEVSFLVRSFYFWFDLHVVLEWF